MGNICDRCLNSSTDESEYVPVESQETYQQKGKQTEKTFDNYQTIINKASSEFINSKFRTKNDNYGSLNNIEVNGALRKRVLKVPISTSFVDSPPQTSLKYSSTGVGSGGNGSSGDFESGGSPLGKLAKEQAILSALYARPNIDPKMEKVADDVANSLVRRHAPGSIDSSVGNSNGVSAVISFKSFDQPVHAT